MKWQNEKERALWIKYQMGLKGHSQASIARKLGTHRANVNMVINRKYRNKKIEREVARAIGMKVRELWRKVNEQ